MFKLITLKSLLETTMLDMFDFLPCTDRELQTISLQQRKSACRDLKPA